eukprot:TRINITY_DN6390_c0_g1_i1.p1 TRINITY_DN6390_c0_g1~~TRINITY_DN6390_c0_g1_i1.p1  ORF type:complete len:580 (+),score=130.92 TRINITY_DN6390_c0_g1_i1:164-1903(+)
MEAPTVEAPDTVRQESLRAPSGRCIQIGGWLGAEGSEAVQSGFQPLARSRSGRAGGQPRREVIEVLEDDDDLCCAAAGATPVLRPSEPQGVPPPVFAGLAGGFSGLGPRQVTEPMALAGPEHADPAAAESGRADPAPGECKRLSSGQSVAGAAGGGGMQRDASVANGIPDSKEVYGGVTLQLPDAKEKEKETGGKVKHDKKTREPVYKNIHSHRLVNCMKLGLHKSIEELSHRDDRALDPRRDFTIKSRYRFGPQGGAAQLSSSQQSQPPQRSCGSCSPFAMLGFGGDRTETDFEFTDYSPMCYRHIRRYFGVEAYGSGSYMESLCGTQWKVSGAGKSSALLYYAGRFVVKTMTKEESKFLRRILHLYYHHVRNNHYTFLPHFLGHYSIRPRWQGAPERKCTFIVMKNVFGSRGHTVHDKYDLKGSWIGRFAERTESILKDLDLRENLFIGPSRRPIVEEQIMRDSMFLEECQIMDYSFLVGIHRPETPRGRRRRPQRPIEGERCLEADDGGMCTEGGGAAHAGEIYYFGIIDILQRYTPRKRAETALKGIISRRAGISCVPPGEYARRFREFILRIIV